MYKNISKIENCRKIIFDYFRGQNTVKRPLTPGVLLNSRSLKNQIACQQTYDSVVEELVEEGILEQKKASDVITEKSLGNIGGYAITQKGVVEIL